MAIERTALLCAALLGAGGCFAPRGILLTYTTLPYAMPYEQAGHAAPKSCHVDITQLKEPFSSVNLSVTWTSRVVAEAAAKSDMTELRYADIQTLSILNGLYKRRRLVFYGE